MTTNERISAWFEPKPDYKPRFRRDGVAQELEGQLSEKGFWRWTVLGGWQPLDYDTDEAANARLLEAIPHVRLEHLDDGWSCCADWLWQGGIPDRKTAIVMAFCKFAGLDSAEGTK